MNETTRLKVCSLREGAHLGKMRVCAPCRFGRPSIAANSDVGVRPPRARELPLLPPSSPLGPRREIGDGSRDFASSIDARAVCHTEDYITRVAV